MTDWSKWLGPEAKTTGEATVLGAFGTTDHVQSGSTARIDGEGWVVDLAPQSPVAKLFQRQRSVPLFEVPGPVAGGSILVYQAKLRCERLNGQAYLEMWCRLGRREYFSRGSGFNQGVTGTTGWREVQIPFLLKAGQQADQVRLNLAIEGDGKVWIQAIELLRYPLSGSSATA